MHIIFTCLLLVSLFIFCICLYLECLVNLQTNSVVLLLFFFMTLWHFFQDEEDVKAIARLYADMGESYVDLIAAGKFHGLC